MISDEMLVRLTIQWEANLEENYPLHPETPHVFSERFCRKMEKLLRQAARTPGQQRAIRWGKRTAAALVAAALLTFTVAMAVPELRARFFQMVRDVYEKYSTIRYEEVESGYVPGEFVECEMGYVPEGFTLIQNRVTERSKNQRYTGPNGFRIFFNQVRLDKTVFALDTEKVDAEKIILSGDRIAWYLDNETLNVIYWDNEEYSFRISSHLPKEELIKMAESTNMKKKHEN